MMDLKDCKSVEDVHAWLSQSIIVPDYPFPIPRIHRQTEAMVALRQVERMTVDRAQEAVREMWEPGARNSLMDVNETIRKLITNESNG
ncbi:hypothetical protein [Jiella pelagia]|uniref:Uncharacterized protein n=1 Tax=Jiella pelagia TaxID=2986949 RepID=A0ABY7C2S0_9HYPH|nr:hypothetical protein [Jiella pelagia]WAP69058.1 hypothetical protein OH818_01605 [Jiella pelagia]